MDNFVIGDYILYVNENHRFGTDAFLLSYFSKVKKDSIVCDLCTGCGIIPILLMKNFAPKIIYAIDIQNEAIELLEKTVIENKLENVIAPICADLKILTEIPSDSIDFVTVNPPYMTAGSGQERFSQAQAVARHEIMCNTKDVCKTAGRILKYGGYLKMCHRPDRLSDVMYYMRKYDVEPKNITLVYNTPNEKPWLLLISGKKGAKPGIQIEKPMILRKDDMQYTEEFTKIYE